MTNSTDVLTTQQAARILGLSTTSVQKMVISGELEAWVTPGGHRRIFRSAIDKLVQSRGTSTPNEVGSRPMRVLLAEDDPVQVAYFQALLARGGHQVTLTVASDASQALIQLERQRPDLVVTDLMMSPFDGYHLINAMSQEAAYQSIEVIVLTALTHKEVDDDGRLPNWVTLYQKPLQAERLLGYLDALATRLNRNGQFIQSPSQAKRAVAA
ncbi:MAG: response regulator [Rhodoferax sp.]|nr:response regulator [Rhodoferax sp.]